MTDEIQQQPFDPQSAQKSAESCEKIVKAAFKEFGEHGYEGASTNQICQAAGISKGLLYHYFKNKERLFLSVCDLCIHDIEEEVFHELRITDTVDIDALSAFYKKNAQFFLTHPNHYQVLCQILGSSAESIEKYVADKRKVYKEKAGIALRLFLSRSHIRPGVDKELALELLLDMMDVVQNRYFTAIRRRNIPVETAQRTMENEVRAALDMILNGLLDKSGSQDEKEGKI